MFYYMYIDISFSLASSSVYRTPLLDIGLLNRTPLNSFLGNSHPVATSHPAKIIAPQSLRASRLRLLDSRSPLKNTSNPTTIFNPSIITMF